MVPTMVLPPGTRVLDVSQRVRAALEQFDALEPTKYDLAHWVTGPYRRTLVVGGQDHWPLALRVASDVPAVVAEARAALARAREATRSLDGGLIELLPDRVHVVRVRDGWDSLGFAPIDVRGATLAHRVLSVLLADYLMRPEAYVARPRLQENTLPDWRAEGEP